MVMFDKLVRADCDRAFLLTLPAFNISRISGVDYRERLVVHLLVRPEYLSAIKVRGVCDIADTPSVAMVASGEMAEVDENQLVVDHQSDLDRKVQKLVTFSRQCDGLRSLLGLWGARWQNDSCHIQLAQQEVTLFGTSKTPYILIPIPT